MRAKAIKFQVDLRLCLILLNRPDGLACSTNSKFNGGWVGELPRQILLEPAAFSAGHWWDVGSQLHFERLHLALAQPDRPIQPALVCLVGQ